MHMLGVLHFDRDELARALQHEVDFAPIVGAIEADVDARIGGMVGFINSESTKFSNT